MPCPTTLYSVAEIRDIEHAALAALPAFTLMQRAGRAASDLASDILGEQPGKHHVLALAGPGNNGGDALEAAANLAYANFNVTVLMFADVDKLSPDAKQAHLHAMHAGVKFADTTNAAAVLKSVPWNLIIDGLFGIGLARAITSPLHGIVELLNSLNCRVLSLDVPSGLNADTGTIIGTPGIAVKASHTITFIGNKLGLHTSYGRDYAGKVSVVSLDIKSQHFISAHARLITPDSFAGALRKRPHNSHKGSYGDVIVAGGAHGMNGAVILAATAAAKCGAGRVFAAFLEDSPAYDPLHPELMCRLAKDLDLAKGTVVVGPGLGTSASAQDLVSRVLNTDAPIVVDADALNLIASEEDLQQQLTKRKSLTLLTPHPLEAARLLASTAAQVQLDRLLAARSLAHRFNAVVILKGSGSIIARPDGKAAINTTGNPGLATAGSGDVLSGICGALMAQQWETWPAALGATWLHGHAADQLVAQGTGPIGLTASELIPVVRAALNRLTERQTQTVSQSPLNSRSS